MGSGPERGERFRSRFRIVKRKRRGAVVGNDLAEGIVIALQSILRKSNESATRIPAAENTSAAVRCGQNRDQQLALRWADRGKTQTNLCVRLFMLGFHRSRYAEQPRT